MEKIIFQTIENHCKKVIETAGILLRVEKQLGVNRFELKGGYRSFASFINSFCEKGFLSPVKASGINGRNPPLYNKYRILIGNEKKLCNELVLELQSLHPKLDKSYYFKNPEAYKEDRDYILMLSQYLLDTASNSSLKYRCTMNERSFEIFNNEKFLESHGKVLLKRLGLSLEDLNCYKTLEAFFYILLEPKDRFNILIIENKDTFYSVVKFMERKPKRQIYGINVDMLIYGEGKKIINSYSFIEEVAMDKEIERVYYFGDLDYEGIGIYNSLSLKYGKDLIVPHVRLYQELLKAAKKPPKLRTNQSEVPLEPFLEHFDEESRREIAAILYDGKYIPQEAVKFVPEK
ncbi:Wadjet anti-phage system protein JetD domain-containing protein [Acetivibrio straminisolvens]|uniref:Wadjet anti-phage system protein JetD domain-containing protein n=1 Tax=Acetivibrio straminisolvens TaxID=253314 RepID=UPI00223E9B99|nr:Wadjet anti-phage system protein JetD domain-containing protein [Acetivibrio straminisolvens]